MHFPKLSSAAVALPLALGLFAGLAGCSKDDIPLVIPATSSLSGTISPIGSVITVTASAPGGATFTATPDSVTGTYTFTGLTVGTVYTLSYAPATNYAAPATQTATVVAGTVSVVPPLTLITTPNATAASFAIELDAEVNGGPFALNTEYTKADGQTFKATKFKYLFSNVKLTRADGTEYLVPESYYLVDAAVPTSTHFLLNNVPVGNYTGMSFILGVDAVRNSSGAQTGALDPGNDLYWSWSQGYIFLKMEGTSAQSPTSALVFHVGGANNIRTISPSFGTAVLPVVGGHIPEIHMGVNPLALFENAAAPANNVNFVSTYNVMAGADATRIADNYTAGMFTVEHIHAN
jgi:hypothetical protein